MDYVKLAKTVIRLINENGRAIQVQKLSAVAADPDKPWEGPGVPTIAKSLDVIGVFVPPSGSDFGIKFVSSELLSRVSEVLLLGPHPTEDLTSINQIVDEGLTFGVSWVVMLKPAGVVMLYAVGVSR